MAHRMGITAGQDAELKELEKDVAPEVVLDQIEQQEQEGRADAPPSPK
jgi:hypothetical protein